MTAPRYIPAGTKRNVRGTYVKNPKKAENINKMFWLWYEKKFGKAER